MDELHNRSPFYIGNQCYLLLDTQHTKENDLDEYKIRKQIYLLDLDYNLLREMEKNKLLNEFMALYLY